ncbi:TetR/AcrR family transcriptional regulator [Actinoplanes sp. NPDC023801]|uniref:TetR/AcrR family transcriptional regulator n=1 Tax=Actinoplanes sp. NPDC023801 TaxID=3154595 RepID=UPI0033F0A52B
MLAAVTTLLVEEGYEALTVDAVAARSGVHRTTVYRRWRDAGGLLADTLDAARDEPWEPPDTGSLTGDLIEINRQIVAALTAEPSLVRALIAASFRSPAAAHALRSFWEDRYARAAEVVHRAAARGETGAGVDARSVIVTACAPVFHELVLMRIPAPADIAERYARIAAAAAGQLRVQ